MKFKVKPTTKGMGIFVDKAKKNAFLKMCFTKVSEKGNFNDKYIETTDGRYINHSGTPNAKCEITEDGIAIFATRNILNEEIVCDYKQLLDLFPGDNSIRKLIPMP